MRHRLTTHVRYETDGGSGTMNGHYPTKRPFAAPQAPLRRWESGYPKPAGGVIRPTPKAQSRQTQATAIQAPGQANQTQKSAGGSGMPSPTHPREHTLAHTNIKGSPKKGTNTHNSDT